MELNQLEQLVTIAKEGTISKASEVLLLSQPALTRSIQKLEDELGLQLFDRTKNKITLNDNGYLAVELAQSLLIQAQTMVDTLHAHERSKRIVSIGSIAPAPSWGLQHLISLHYPDMKSTSTLNSHHVELIKGLKDLEYSIIITTEPIQDDQYVCLPLFEEYLFISLPPEHHLSSLKEISFNDLNGESILLLSKIGFWNEMCMSKLPKSHLLYQDDTLVFQELAKMSTLPIFRSNITLLKDNRTQNRINIPLTDKEAHVTYYAIYHRTNKKIFDFLKEEIKDINWLDVL